MEEEIKKSVRDALDRANARLLELNRVNPKSTAYIYAKRKIIEWWEAYHRGDEEEMKRLDDMISKRR